MDRKCDVLKNVSMNDKFLTFYFCLPKLIKIKKKRFIFPCNTNKPREMIKMSQVKKLLIASDSNQNLLTKHRKSNFFAYFN